MGKYTAHEITARGPLLDKKGHLTQTGFAKNLILDYDRSKIKANALRIKEWDYYLIANDDFAVALTVAKIIPYKSDSFNGTGLEPEHKVELSVEQNSRLPMLQLADDPQYQKAASIVSN